jgi:hypothetical protein
MMILDGTRHMLLSVISSEQLNVNPYGINITRPPIASLSFIFVTSKNINCCVEYILGFLNP